MHFIDSHCHLDMIESIADIDQILAKAKLNNVRGFVLPSVSADNFNSVINLANKDTDIYIALGLHPCFFAQHRPQDITLLEQLVDKHLPYAIGEIGLDFFINVDQKNKEEQLQLFEKQVLIAKKSGLPIILHVRKAHDQVLQIIKKLKFPYGGIVHAFNGSAVQAKRYTQEFGFKLGFGGAMTHPRALKLRSLATNLPLTDIVLETDAPDMALYDMDEVYNEPANIKYIAQTLSELRSESLAEITSQICKNTTSCLGLDKNKYA